MLISEEECFRTIQRGNYYAIQPVLPELRPEAGKPVMEKEYSSADHTVETDVLTGILRKAGYLQ